MIELVDGPMQQQLYGDAKFLIPGCIPFRYRSAEDGDGSPWKGEWETAEEAAEREAMEEVRDLKLFDGERLYKYLKEQNEERKTIRGIQYLINYHSPGQQSSKRMRQDEERSARNSYHPPREQPIHPPLNFTEKDLEVIIQPHNDALVVSLNIGKTWVHRVLVDTGSYANVLYLNTFKRLGLSDSELTTSSEMAIGFGGHKTPVLGSCNLNVNFEVDGHSFFKTTEFKVIDVFSKFNAILGRPLLIMLKAEVSIYHLTIKFPVEDKLYVIRGDQLAAKECESNLCPREINALDGKR